SRGRCIPALLRYSPAAALLVEDGGLAPFTATLSYHKNDRFKPEKNRRRVWV
ncbi:MAG: hypothetical protein ACI8VE_002662, partial [Natrialbaceae archaeon]